LEYEIFKSPIGDEFYKIKDPSDKKKYHFVIKDSKETANLLRNLRKSFNLSQSAVKNYPATNTIQTPQTTGNFDRFTEKTPKSYNKDDYLKYVQNHTIAAGKVENYSPLLQHAWKLRQKYGHLPIKTAESYIGKIFNAAYKSGQEEVVLPNGKKVNIHEVQQTLIDMWGDPTIQSWKGYRLFEPDVKDVYKFRLPDQNEINVDPNQKIKIENKLFDMLNVKYVIPTWLNDRSATPDSLVWKKNVDQINQYLISKFGDDPVEILRRFKFNHNGSGSFPV